MNEAEVRRILGDTIQEDGSLRSMSAYVCCKNIRANRTVTLDGNFYPEDLEAIAWWMQYQEGKS